MSHKFFALLFVTALILTGVANSQGTPPPASQPDQGRVRGRINPEGQLEHLTRELGLTSAQQDRIKPLLLNRRQKLDALRGDNSVSHDDRRTRVHAIDRETNDEIEAVLRPEQKQKFEATLGDMRGDIYRDTQSEADTKQDDSVPGESAQPQL